jgi:hypothetical protein
LSSNDGYSSAKIGDKDKKQKNDYTRNPSRLFHVSSPEILVWGALEKIRARCFDARRIIQHPENIARIKTVIRWHLCCKL